MKKSIKFLLREKNRENKLDLALEKWLSMRIKGK